MRFKEIILEYDRKTTAEKSGAQIAKAAARESQLQDLEQEQQIDAVLEKAESADPTRNKKYVMWIIRQFVKNGLAYEDINEFLGDDIKQFHELPKQRKQQMGVESDINKLSWQNLRDIANKIKSPDIEQDTDSNLEYENIDDIKVMYVGDMGQLLVPRTQAAACELGKGTKWCTAATKSKNYFETYNSSGNLYVWIPSKKMPEKKSSNKYQFHFPNAQFKDQNDADISQDLFKYFRNSHPLLQKLFAKGEQELLDNESLGGAANYAKFAGNRWPELEKRIKSQEDSWAAFFYAYEVLGERWPEMEDVIKKGSRAASEYAQKILRQRWREAEEYIKQEAMPAAEYANSLFRSRRPWRAAEDTISEDPKASYIYALRQLKARFPKGEHSIAKDTEYAFQYARHILKGRFPEAEETFANGDPQKKENYEIEFGVDLDHLVKD